jgi:predicted nucleic acid-binding protein
MVLVDSSVWIDFFGNAPRPQVHRLATMLQGHERVLLGDLVLAEVLQGVHADREFRLVRNALLTLETVRLASPSLAITSARNYRALRREGVTVRKAIDCLIATWCIETGVPLLHSDRDFAPFEQHLGLQVL